MSLARVLEDVRSNHGPSWWNQITKCIIIFGIACGMVHIHSHDVVHRFLTPSHVLLDDRHYPKISDYGYGRAEFELRGPKDKVYVPDGEFSPDVATPKLDVYSYGVIVWEIVTEKKAETSVPILVSSFPRGVESLGKIVEHCMNPDPVRRPSFAQIVHQMQLIGDLWPGFDRTDYDSAVDLFLKGVQVASEDKALLKGKYDKQEVPPEVGQQGADIPVMDVHRLVQSGREAYKNQNEELALRLLTHATEQGSLAGSFSLGQVLYRGHDRTRGRDLIKAASDRGFGPAMMEYASILNQENHPEEAMELYKKCFRDKGDPDACDFAGRIAERQGQVARALDFYRKGGDMGKCNWARLTLEKYGSDQRCRNEAIKILEQLSSQGYSVASMNLAGVFMSGRYGIEKNEARAATYYLAAARENDPGGCSMYAYALSSGTGVLKNVREAVWFYEKAIEGGDSRALYNYGSLLLVGDQIPKDEKKAVSYLKMAADKGVIAAQFKYAECAEKGIGMSSDISIAKRYYQMVTANQSPGNRFLSRANEALKRQSGY